MYDDFDRQRQATRRRTQILIIAFGLMGLTGMVRLGYLQLLHADYYREQMEDWLKLPPEYLAPLRGDILDRNNTVLAQDAPSWQVEVYYEVLDGRLRPDGRSRYVYRLARKYRRDGRFPKGTSPEAAEEMVHQAIATSWQKLADLTRTPMPQILDNSNQIVSRVRALHDYVAVVVGGLEPGTREEREFQVREEQEFHPVLTDLSADVAGRVRQELPEDQYPWIRVRTSTTRQYLDHPSLAPLLGRLKQVSAEALLKDPNKDDTLLRLHASEKIGDKGIEYLAESLLRGKRGMIVRHRARQDELVEPVRGRDVRLTIDTNLQEWIYQRLGQAVHDCPTASGGAAVVLDVGTREVLAAVSYPGYTYKDLSEDGQRWLKDAVRTPGRLRVVANSYPPGSIVKPVTVLATLSNGLASPGETIDCQGYLEPGVNAFRCWTVSRQMAPHGPVDAAGALEHSCNIYCFRMAQRLGPQRLCEWLEMFGVGRPAGTGLLEEFNGRLPTKVLAAQGRRPTDADAQNYSIGQGELELTPMQAANLGATIATGIWRPVTLLCKPSGAERPAVPLPGPAECWQAVREGMYRVVNSPTGTARDYAYIPGLKIAGKTGTAQAEPRRYAFGYDLKMHDGVIETKEFPDKLQAEEYITRLGESVVQARLVYEKWWPGPRDPKALPTHAWFMGFAPYDNPRIAVAVIIEYGGGGGKVAGPAARDIFAHYFGVPVEHGETTGAPTE